MLTKLLQFLFSPEGAEAAGGAAADADVEDGGVEEVVATEDGDGEKKPEGAADLSRSYDDLAKKDRELHERYQRIRAQESELKELADLRRAAKENPGEVLHRLQINPMSLSDSILGIDPKKGDDEGDVGALKSQIAELRQWKAQQEQETMFHREAQRIRSAVDSAQHEFVSMSMAEDPDRVTRDVLNEASVVYRETGAFPDYAKILNKIEDRYTTNVLALMEKLSGAKKVKEKLQLVTAQKPNETKKASKKTMLTNDLNDSPTERRERIATDAAGIDARRRAFLAHLPKLLKESEPK